MDVSALKLIITIGTSVITTLFMVIGIVIKYRKEIESIRELIYKVNSDSVKEISNRLEKLEEKHENSFDELGNKISGSIIDISTINTKRNACSRNVSKAIDENAARIRRLDSKLDKKLDEINKYFTNVINKLSTLEERSSSVDIQIDMSVIENINGRINVVYEKLSRYDDINDSVKEQKKWAMEQDKKMNQLYEMMIKRNSKN